MSNSRIARGAAWVIACSVLARALGLIGTLVLVRFVAPDDYGEVSAAVAVILTVNQFTTLGVGIYVIATRDVTRAEVFHATVIHVFLGAIALLALLLLGKPLAPVFSTPNLYHYIPGLALSAFIDRLTFMPERILIRRLDFRRVGLYRAAGEVLYTVASVGSAAMGWGGMSIVIGNLARSVVRGMLFVVSVPLVEWMQWTLIRLALLRKIAAYGLTILMGASASAATRRWDNLLVARFFGPAVMANYALAYNLADIPAIHIGEQLSDVMQASFAQMDSAERRRTLLRSLGVVGLVTFPIAVGLGMVGPMIAAALLKPEWAAAGTMLLVLAVLSLARPVFGAIASLVLVETGPRLLATLEWLSLALLLISLATLGRISPLWACGAVGLTFVVRTAAVFLVAHVSCGMSPRLLLSPLMPPLLACVPMAAIILAVRAATHGWEGYSPVFGLLVEVAIGACTFLAAAALVSRPSLRDLIALIRKQRTSR